MDFKIETWTINHMYLIFSYFLRSFHFLQKKQVTHF